MASIPTLIKQASGAAAATLDQVLGLDTDDAATVIQSIFRGERERAAEQHPELQKRESEAPPPMPFARSTTAAVLREVRLQIDSRLSSRKIALLAAGCVATIRCS